jgi:hypothetical protein
MQKKGALAIMLKQTSLKRRSQGRSVCLNCGGLYKRKWSRLKNGQCGKCNRLLAKKRMIDGCVQNDEEKVKE